MGKVAGDFVVSADVLHAFREASALIRVDSDMCQLPAYCDNHALNLIIFLHIFCLSLSNAMTQKDSPAGLHIMLKCILLSLCRALWHILRAKMKNLAG